MHPQLLVRPHAGVFGIVGRLLLLCQPGADLIAPGVARRYREAVFEPGSSKPAQELVRGLAGLDIVGCDVVEVAPQFDGPGQITALLAANLMFLVALLSMLQATLTLPGIAGIVLTIGMALARPTTGHRPT